MVCWSSWRCLFDGLAESSISPTGATLDVMLTLSFAGGMIWSWRLLPRSLWTLPSVRL